MASLDPSVDCGFSPRQHSRTYPVIQQQRDEEQEEKTPFNTHTSAVEVLRRGNLDVVLGNFRFDARHQAVFWELARALRMCWRLMALAALSDALQLGTWAFCLTDEVARSGASYSTFASVLHDSTTAFLVCSAAGGFEDVLRCEGNQVPTLMQGIALLANFYLQMAFFAGSVAIIQLTEAAILWPGIKVVMFMLLGAAMLARSTCVLYVYSRFRNNLLEGAALMWDRRNSSRSAEAGGGGSVGGGCGGGGGCAGGGGDAVAPSEGGRSPGGGAPRADAAATAAGAAAVEGGGASVRETLLNGRGNARMRVLGFAERVALALSGSFLLPRGLPETGGVSTAQVAQRRMQQLKHKGYKSGLMRVVEQHANTSTTGEGLQGGDSGTFEFTSWDEQILLATVQAMRIAAVMHALQVVSTTLLVIASMVGPSGKGVGALTVAMEVGSNAVIAMTLQHAALSFESIVTTEGEDVQNLMHGLGLLTGLFERLAHVGLSLSALQTYTVVSSVARAAPHAVSVPVAALGAVLAAAATKTWFDRLRVGETRDAMEQALSVAKSKLS